MNLQILAQVALLHVSSKSFMDNRAESGYIIMRHAGLGENGNRNAVSPLFTRLPESVPAQGGPGRAWSGIMKLREQPFRVILLVAALLILFLSLHRFYVVATKHLNTRYDLGIESINLATIRSLRQGKAIYADSFFRKPPFIITIYNPLFHYITAIMPQSKTNEFYTGRFISLVSTVLSLILLFLPGYSRGFPKIRVVSIFAVSWVLLHPIFLESAVYMHPDMLALSLSALAVVTLETPRTNRRVVIAALLAFLGFAAKQSFVCATTACFLFLLFQDRRKAFLFALTSIVSYSSFFIFMHRYWGEGHFFCTIASVLAHPSYLNLTLMRILELLRQPMFVFLLLIVAFSFAYAYRKEKSALFHSPYFIYLEVAAIVPLIGLGKIGGETSYYLEFILASSLWIVFFARKFYSNFSPAFPALFLLCLVAATALELSVTKRSAYLLTEDPHNSYYKYHMPERVHAELMELTPPDERFLVINCHVMLPFLKETYLNDPYNYFMMWFYGLLDPAPMIEAMDKKFFSVILFAYPNNPCEIPGMYTIPHSHGTNRILGAIQKNYRLAKTGVFLYYVPNNS
jgi:hypothetical protein